QQRQGIAGGAFGGARDQCERFLRNLGGFLRQRFDLRRIEPEEMIEFLSGIAAKETAEITEEALALITRAAEGSARDALSLLDQAIAHSAGETGAEQVRAMLGLADRGRVIDLFEMIMKGDAAAALIELGRQYADGADPMAVLRDLAELTHWISVVKINVENADDPTIGADERDRGKTLADGLPMRALTRMWQMLLKALEEVSAAPNAMMAAEMAIIRLTHVADLPAPADIVKKLTTDQGGPRPVPPAGGGGGGGVSVSAQGGATPQPTHRPDPAPRASTEALIKYQSFADVVALIREKRDMRLLTDVERFVGLATFAPGRIDFEPAEGAPADLAQQLAMKLGAWTGARWMVSVVGGGGAATIAEERRQEEAAERRELIAHPLIAAALETFPGAEIRDVRSLLPEEPAAPPPPDDEDDDDWSPVDPFAE
ncbi:MAG: DNA polymerase III subunit gamma/tau, partial [Pseudomonadota bacterium]